MEQGLNETFYCNYGNRFIQDTAAELSENTHDSVELTKKTFEYVRDKIIFGFDLYKVKASETLQNGFGVCWNKSLLLTALLRCNKIPAEFCSIPVRTRFIAPVIGLSYMLGNNPFNHCFVRANLNERWVRLEPTLDNRTYSTFYRHLNLTWGIDWNGSEDCELYTENIVGQMVIHADIDKTINNKVGNRELPKFMVTLINKWLNVKMWKQIEKATG